MTKGFTLIELMISIAIIGVVFGVVITSSAAIQKQSRDTQRQANLKTIQSALEQYHADVGVYPDTLPAVTLYLTPIPKDPLNSGTYVYTYVAGPLGSIGNWAQYCLYAKLENPPSPTIVNSQCTLVGPNYPVNQP